MGKMNLSRKKTFLVFAIGAELKRIKLIVRRMKSSIWLKLATYTKFLVGLEVVVAINLKWLEFVFKSIKFRTISLNQKFTSSLLLNKLSNNQCKDKIHLLLSTTIIIVLSCSFK